MKMLGLIGGMSWESTDIYYQSINQMVKERLGGLHSGDLLMRSLDFAEIEEHQTAGNWAELTETMIREAKRLERAGASAIVICTNTMHKMAEDVQAVIGIPLLHIADATAAAIQAASASCPALLATRFTMEQDFYKGRLSKAHGIDVLVPDAADRETVHRIIYEELCCGIVRPESKQAYLEVIARLRALGADSVILGCTEIGMLIKQEDLTIPAFDTTRIHARAAVDFALGLSEKRLTPVFTVPAV